MFIVAIVGGVVCLYGGGVVLFCFLNNPFLQSHALQVLFAT